MGEGRIRFAEREPQASVACSVASRVSGGSLENEGYAEGEGSASEGSAGSAKVLLVRAAGPWVLDLRVWASVAIGGLIHH